MALRDVSIKKGNSFSHNKKLLDLAIKINLTLTIIAPTNENNTPEELIKEFNSSIRNTNFIIGKFSNAGDRHVPQKMKTLRSNQAPFMTKELRGEI